MALPKEFWVIVFVVLIILILSLLYMKTNYMDFKPV